MCGRRGNSNGAISDSSHWVRYGGVGAPRHQQWLNESSSGPTAKPTRPRSSGTAPPPTGCAGAAKGGTMDILQWFVWFVAAFSVFTTCIVACCLRLSGLISQDERARGIDA